MRYAYKNLSFRSDSLQRIATINAVIADFVSQGFRLSVRQLYYQLVAAAIIENTERSYKRTADLINNARIAGLMDWDAIEDRGRDIELKTRWSGGDAIVQAAADSFHMDMWVKQEYRVFCVVEKAALAHLGEGRERRAATEDALVPRVGVLALDPPEVERIGGPGPVS